jgi:hypothetical protein
MKTTFRRLREETRSPRRPIGPPNRSSVLGGRLMLGLILLALIPLLAPMPLPIAIGSASTHAGTWLRPTRPDGWVLAPRGLQPCGWHFIAVKGPVPTRVEGDDDVHIALRSFVTTPLLVRPVPRVGGGTAVSQRTADAAPLGLWQDVYANVWCGGQCVSGQACCEVTIVTPTSVDTTRPAQPPPSNSTKPARPAGPRPRP